MPPGQTSELFLNSSSNREEPFITSLVTKFKNLSRKAFIIKNPLELSLEHSFETVSLALRGGAVCSNCRKLVYGIVGLQCKQCKRLCHEDCLASIGRCRGSERKSFKNVFQEHKFETAWFKTLTFCDHCGALIKGLYNQGLKCESGCEMKIHSTCKHLVDRPCREARINQVSMGDFEIEGLIGEGSFSKVYVAQFKNKGKKYALKVIKKSILLNSSNTESAFTEKKLLTWKGSCPFLATCHCSFQTKEKLIFVMEYVVGRDLYYHLEESGRFTEDRARFYGAEVIIAINYLHKNNIIYRDLKLDNIILDERGHCKLIDFGLSKDFGNDKYGQPKTFKTATYCGTLEYMAPEIIQKQHYSYSVDWWAFGVLMFEMMAGYSPFMNNDENLSSQLIFEPLVIPAHLRWSKEATDLVEGLLIKDPVMRLGCQPSEGCEEALMGHPFFRFDGSHQWQAIYDQRITPPYEPTEKDLNISLTQRESTSPQDPDEAKELEGAHSEFSGFSYYSDSFK